MSARGEDATEHPIARGGIHCVCQDADFIAGFSEMAVGRRSDGISSAAAAPIATVIAPIVTARASPSTNVPGVW